MDSERHYRRIAKVSSGNTISLIEDAIPYDLGVVYDLRASVSANRIRIYLNEAKIFDFTDNSSPILGGNIALYCWGDEYSHFGDVLVVQ